MPVLAQDSGTKANLVDEIHDLNPVKPKINALIEQVARQIPDSERSAFIISVKQSVSFEAIEQASKQAMQDLFTEEELIVLKTYYTASEARSIDDKRPAYEQALEAAMFRQIDRAFADYQCGAE